MDDLETYRVRVARLDAVRERIELVQGHLRRAEQCLEEACLAEDPTQVSTRWAILDSMRSKAAASRMVCPGLLAEIQEELNRARAALHGTQQTAD